ncbi:hypothetical protein PENANT_c016G10953 [Penicillium antarcticum]|uniref:Rad4 beta-hairpin domain-containing protein n=1 Tax=Penicillium antarcticum TaxID=416450 RepID=A0A1V6Q2T1_9EURO|nr:uncharacterized protein N7508_001292 [Penicillium antarcticum]KAJ5316784.1 hypothetical protein N7508_001292 [Penicillium antarcticum]OQD83588.1 hypothetical protein PENANT_c016G10953 [Penicillium antarcticum]
MSRQTPARSARTRASRGRQQTRKRPGDEDVQDVYQEMLDEAEARDPGQFNSERPIKRRKVGDMKALPVEAKQQRPESSKDDAQQIQTVYDSSSEGESDVEWEDVEFHQPSDFLLNGTAASRGGDEMLEITLKQEPDKRMRAIPKRKPLTGAEKKIRLDVHKSHVLCLLGHVHIRNSWCNDEGTQDFLKKILPKKVIALLHPDEDKPSYNRSTTIMDGLNQAADAFARRFKVTKPGMKRAHWSEDQIQLKQKMDSIMSDAEVFLSRRDFRTQAKMLQGSRDFGAQLFCALLRGVAIETRLVCSLQPLPFSGTVKDMTPSKSNSQYIVISSDDPGSSTDERSKTEKSPTASKSRRIGQPKFAPSRPPQPPVRLGNHPQSRDSSHPVFWVEAFNEAAQKWIAIDPVVTKSLAKPSKFEPPASDPFNLMNYVVAFEDDLSARDVTRRYAKAFNAKTRKLRVESTRNGEKWWDTALLHYEKPFLEDRDEAEISELTSKSAAEPMPRNIQDFKDHPVYALERHVRRNEVIHPKRVIGHVGLGKTSVRTETSEPVYRRSDLHVVRSADKWYRLGRDVRVGEQPLKRVPASRNKVASFGDDEDDNEPEETTLYAESQTEVYKPPPVVNGIIPKNVYGNLDVYVPSMVPPGGVHINRAEAIRAARILGIDYADAVTGFDFRGRRGTAVVNGIVIATEYQEAVEEVLTGLEDQRRLATLEARTAEALRFWRLFLVKLRIAERVKGYAVKGEDQVDEDDIAEEMNVEEGGGGFFPEPGQPANSPLPRALETHLPYESYAEVESGLYGEDEEEFRAGFMPEEPTENDSNSVAAAASAPEPFATRPTSNPQGLSKRNTSNAPRYSLVVVPNHSPGAVAHERRESPEPSSSNALKGSSQYAPIAVDSSTNAGSKSASVVTISQPPSPVQERSSRKYDSDSELEKGSLLSEDPDDEDAIPDWLMSDEE